MKLAVRDVSIEPSCLIFVPEHSLELSFKNFLEEAPLIGLHWVFLRRLLINVELGLGSCIFVGIVGPVFVQIEPRDASLINMRISMCSVSSSLVIILMVP